MLLDDVLSAGTFEVRRSGHLQSLTQSPSLKVDAHTAYHLYHKCLKGDLMRGRTVILVSHHVQLCAPGASYVVALDNGRVQFQGDGHAFQASGVMDGLVQSGESEPAGNNSEAALAAVEEAIPAVLSMQLSSAASTIEPSSDTSSTEVSAKLKLERNKVPRVLVEEEKRAVGRVSRNVWTTYILAFGNPWFWCMLSGVLVLAALSPVAENWWLKCVFYITSLSSICSDSRVGTGRVLYRRGIAPDLLFIILAFMQL
jgi:hypothetical protein